MKDRILVLDDESSILEILGQHLGDEGYDCEQTTSAKRALEMLEAADPPFSVLITDLKMPEMHGLDVVQRATAIDPHLSVIVVTALIEVTNAVEAMRAGAHDYVLKPFNLAEITLSVERALERRRLVLDNLRYRLELEDRVRAATLGLETANAELRRTKEYLENLLHSTADAILTVDPDQVVTFVNEGGLEMFGYPREELEGQAVEMLFAGGAGEVGYVLRMLGSDKPLQNYETEIRHKNGTLIPINMSVSQVWDAEHRPICAIAICKDITPQKRLERELKEMTIRDSLSGLYNQRHFHDRLEAEIERARRQGHPLSLLVFDVDLFKQYNDCHGHLEGDNVLKAIGEVVTECTREHVDLGFRYGGDEFTVILPEADDKQALVIAERIRVSFAARRFDHLTLSVGLMSYRPGYSARSFIRFTDAMMYDAKRSGGNRVYVYNPQAAELDEEAPAGESVSS